MPYVGKNSSRRKKINKWIKEINEKLDNKDCKITDELKNKLRKKKHSVSIRVSHMGMEGKRGRYIPSENLIILNWRSRGFNLATLLHELIHACGGSELDAEAFENTCCSRREGATRPAGIDLDKFVKDTERCRDGRRVGEYTIWDPESGKKWVNIGTKQCPKEGMPLKKNPRLKKSALKKIAKIDECISREKSTHK